MGLTHSSEDPSEQYRNLRFYRNEIKSSPWPGNKVEEMLLWSGRYNKLENNHNYIQWLFPTPEGSGMNPYAQPLREHESKAIREDELASTRVLMAYKMMLDFYGMRLVSRTTGAVARSENWQDRYKHLNRSVHNYRRITRIIESLGELGYERFQVPWITFLIEESVVNRVLSNLNGPCMKHWIGAIKDNVEKEHMHENYLELFKKPKPGISSPPKPLMATTDTTADNGNKRDITRSAANENFSSHDTGAIKQTLVDVKTANGTCCDTKQSETTEIFSVDTVDTVDHGPAGGTNHGISMVSSGEVDTRARGDQPNKPETNVHTSCRKAASMEITDNFPDTANVDFGCAKDDALAVGEQK